MDIRDPWLPSGECISTLRVVSREAGCWPHDLVSAGLLHVCSSGSGERAHLQGGARTSLCLDLLIRKQHHSLTHPFIHVYVSTCHAPGSTLDSESIDVQGRESSRDSQHCSIKCYGGGGHERPQGPGWEGKATRDVRTSHVRSQTGGKER